MAQISFFSQDLPFKFLKPASTRRWIKEVLKKERKRLSALNYIFCSDQYLLTLNEQFLKHKTLTDIITFDNSELPGVVEGDVFISLERVKENAVKFKTTVDDELHRVIIHGVLHLVGYSDKSPRDKSLMRKKEDAYLSLRGKLLGD
jgi:probable rRNA maturation factor